MDMGFKDTEITELFKLIDKDNGGSIDEKEFVKTLYPEEYRVLRHTCSYGRIFLFHMTRLFVFLV